LPQPFQQPGLADARFPLDEHDLTTPSAAAFPGPQQEFHFRLPSDERHGFSALSRGEAAFGVARGQQAPGQHGFGEAFEGMRTQIAEVEVIAQHGAGGGADDDTVGLVQGLQTRRQVRCFSDHGGFRGGSFADLVADDDWARGDPNADREFDARRPENRGVQVRHRGHDIEGGPRGSLGLVLMGTRIAEIHQDAVAHVFRDEAVVTFDGLGAAGLKRGDHIAQVLGVHRGGERGRSDQIAKHDCQLAAFGPGLNRCCCGKRHRCRSCHRCRRWSRCQGGDSGKEPAAMADRRHADGDHVLARQVRQDVPVDIVLAERRLVLLKTELPKPTRDIDRHPGHPLFNAPAKPLPRANNSRVKQTERARSLMCSSSVESKGTRPDEL
jgi:hypothetical protein